MPGELTLVIGGVRSGKSAVAERLAAATGRPVLYVATGQAGDVEMAARVAAHRARRPAQWTTVEAPLDPGPTIAAARTAGCVVLLDCLGMLVSNLLLAVGEDDNAAARVDRALDSLLALLAADDARLIVVSSEAGLSLVPLSPLGRQFLDLLGEANQRVARAASRVYLVVAGLPVELRALAGDGEAWRPEPDGAA